MKSDPHYGQIQLCKFPYPYQAAFSIASDIDSANVQRFRAVHAFFCGTGIIQADSDDWRVLGFSKTSQWMDKDAGGFRSLALDVADSFFLIGDPTTFGAYRYQMSEDKFVEDIDNEENCANLIFKWLYEGKIDTFHTFLHYTRKQVMPLLADFYRRCSENNLPKPCVWTNHSKNNTPSGICPDNLQPNRYHRFCRLTARSLVGPLFGRKRLPISCAFVRYDGDSPASPYYINDLLAANGLKFVWLNNNDISDNQITLKEKLLNGRSSILHPVTMDDGVRYWQFKRCFGWRNGSPRCESYLRDSKAGSDASHLITPSNLKSLCDNQGTCILYCHWTHDLSFPLSDETIGRFALLRRYKDEGRVWVTSASRLLEWTRKRTFLKVECDSQATRLIVNLAYVDDPLFGREEVTAQCLNGFALQPNESGKEVIICVAGKPLRRDQIARNANVYWLNTSPTPALVS